jgi:hypothetical protein
MQSPTTTDVGIDRWQINDEVIRLRLWASERSQSMPTASGGEWIIGSGPTSWLRLEDERRRVSRKHATLSREDGKWILRDAGSKNGILVEGMKRKEVALEPGVEVWVGGVTLIAESNRLTTLRAFLGRILGWTSDQVRAVDPRRSGRSRSSCAAMATSCCSPAHFIATHWVLIGRSSSAIRAAGAPRRLFVVPRTTSGAWRHFGRRTAAPSAFGTRGSRVTSPT